MRRESPESEPQSAAARPLQCNHPWPPAYKGHTAKQERKAALLTGHLGGSTFPPIAGFCGALPQYIS